MCVCMYVNTHTLFSNLNPRSFFPERASCRPILRDIVAQPLSYISSSFFVYKLLFFIIVYVHDAPVCTHGMCVWVYASRGAQAGVKGQLGGGSSFPAL